MSRALVLLAALAAVGCAGVIGISDIHVDDGPDGAAPIASEPPPNGDGGSPLNAEGGTPTIDAGSDGAGVPVPKRVFVTTATTVGSFGGPSGADTICNTAAATTNLGGTWVAWVSSSSSNAISRLTSSGPWSRLDGKVVASGRAELTSGTLANPISITEHGAAVDASSAVWTGTTTAGAGATYTCLDWTDGESFEFGEFGTPTATDGTWTEPSIASGTFYQECNEASHLYCFEQ